MGQAITTCKGEASDFFFVPSGTVHAIGEGILILETQQNSDTTYRLYDYNRRDSEGKLRELHLEKSMEVIETPFVSMQQSVQYEEIEDLYVTKFIECPYFSVEKWELDGVVNLTQKSISSFKCNRWRRRANTRY